MLSFSVLLLMISGHVIIADDVTDGTELLMSFLVHRHGDRTPSSESSLVYSTDPDALEALTAPYGYGQLTLAGKRTAYKMGQYLRERYNELLAPTYNKSEVYIRSTDSTRAKMTILSALSAVYPPVGERWNDELPWEPVPYTTLPLKYDFNTPEVNCPTYLSAMNSAYAASDPAFTAKFGSVLAVWSNLTGLDTSLPSSVATIYDVYVSQLSLGLDLGEELDAILPELEEAAGDAWGFLYGDDDYIPLQAGVLLQEFYDYSKKVIAGEDTQRLRIYSAHDFNVFSFEAVTRVNRQGAPKYATAYSLELRKVISTGAYVVLPVYKSPDEEVKYLQVEGCEQLCDYDQFIQLTQQNALDIDTWRDKCGFTEDLVVDEWALQ